MNHALCVHIIHYYDCFQNVMFDMFVTSNGSCKWKHVRITAFVVVFSFEIKDTCPVVLSSLNVCHPYSG